MKYSVGSRQRGALGIIVSLLLVSLLGCGPAAAPPAPAANQSSKAEPAKEAKSGAQESKTAKETKPQAKQLVKLRVPYVAVSGVMAPLWVTKEKGIFEKYGLDVELLYIASSTTLTQAMLSGEVQLAETGANPVVTANLAGADLVLIAGTTNLLAFSLYADPSIKKVEDLKGKAVGVSRYGASTDFGARLTLQRFGLQPDKDVAIMQTGGSPETLAALTSGNIQGAVFGAPSTLKAKKAGMHELVKMTDLKIPYSVNCFATSKKFLAENKETVSNFLKALVEGISVIKKDKAFTMQVLGKYTKTEDAEVLGETYEYYLTDILPQVPYATEESVQTILDAEGARDPKAKEVKPASYIDNSVLKELDDSGFVKKLY